MLSTYIAAVAFYLLALGYNRKLAEQPADTLMVRLLVGPARFRMFRTLDDWRTAGMPRWKSDKQLELSVPTRRHRWWIHGSTKLPAREK